MVATRLHDYAFTKCFVYFFFLGFPVKSSSGFMNFLQCSQMEQFSQRFSLMINLLMDNIHEEYIPHICSFYA